jgi:hypothetical protein
MIIRSNVFVFGNTYWKQISGTAMGTPPACWWATLYFAIHEEDFVPRYQEQVPFYCRFIDDSAGIWLTHEDDDNDNRLWNNFLSEFKYGQLTWKHSERAISTNMLDTTITIEPEKKCISFRLYEKALNLYQYLPPHSAHPPGVLQGLVCGNIFRIVRLCSYKKDRDDAIKNFYLRLRTRGYAENTIKPMFQQSLQRALQSDGQKKPKDESERFFLHLQYHPNDPPSQSFQALFRRTMLHPKCEHTGCSETPLYEMRNLYRGFLCVSRMTIAYHKPRNLQNLLFPRRLPVSATKRNEPADVASFLGELT